VDIINNTVVNRSGATVAWPWIGLFNTQNITSLNGRVLNNLAMKYETGTNATSNIIYANNSVIFDPASAFSDINNLDYSPAPTSGFIDTADLVTATSTDIFGHPRPHGVGPDKGAIEVGSSGIATVSTPTSPTGDTTTTTTTADTGGPTTDMTDTTNVAGMTETTSDSTGTGVTDTTVTVTDTEYSNLDKSEKKPGKWEAPPNSKRDVKPGKNK